HRRDLAEDSESISRTTILDLVANLIVRANSSHTEAELTTETGDRITLVRNKTRGDDVSLDHGRSVERKEGDSAEVERRSVLDIDHRFIWSVTQDENRRQSEPSHSESIRTQDSLAGRETTERNHVVLDTIGSLRNVVVHGSLD